MMMTMTMTWLALTNQFSKYCTAFGKDTCKWSRTHPASGLHFIYHTSTRSLYLNPWKISTLFNNLLHMYLYDYMHHIYVLSNFSSQTTLNDFEWPWPHRDLNIIILSTHDLRAGSVGMLGPLGCCCRWWRWQGHHWRHFHLSMWHVKTEGLPCW